MAASTIYVRGLRELQAAFKRADVTLAREMQVALRGVAEPVKSDAEALARTEITRIGNQWWHMRVGVTQRVVYVAPREKGRLSRRNPRLRRPNFFMLMMGRSLEPALDRNAAKVEAAVGVVLATVGKSWSA